MWQRFLVLAIVVALPSAAHAGGLEKDVKARWLGAWVVTRLEAYSDCGGNFTNNRVNGSLVKSKGDHRFQPGEMAKLVKINAHKSRVDLHLLLSEPILAPYQDGPFTLYRELECKLELEVMVPRDLIKGRKAGAIDQVIAQILERYSTEEQARASKSWNRRERDPYPSDYEFTLARHAVWRAEQANARVQAKLDQAADVVRRVSHAINGDGDYVAGFAEGVQKGRGRSLSECSSLLGAGFSGYRDRSDRSDEENRWDRGRRDGENLIVALELVDRLPGCFVPVPELPAAAQETAQVRVID
jgi:hypothetical protein